MVGNIFRELKAHAPFTVFGVITGIVVLAASLKLPYETAHTIFYVLHPLHVFFSALVTAAMYELHTCPRVGSNCVKGQCNFWALTAIGYAGSIGIATASDSLIPYVAESLLGLPRRELHLGFIEKWWLVNPLALIGIAVAYFKPMTKFPHSLHVLLSTWASLFHIVMAGVAALSWIAFAVIFVFLFLAVWLPCCLSDIVFPLLFVKNNTTKVLDTKQ